MKRLLDLVLGMAKPLGLNMMIVGIMVAVVFMIETHQLNNNETAKITPARLELIAHEPGTLWVFRLEVHYPEHRYHHIVYTNHGVAMIDK